MMYFDSDPKLPAIAFAALAVVLRPAAAAEAWIWMDQCDGPALRVEVRLDDRAVYKAPMPLCRTARHTRGRTSFEFSFVPGRVIAWPGRPEEERAEPEPESQPEDQDALSPDPKVRAAAIRRREQREREELERREQEERERRERLAGQRVQVKIWLAGGDARDGRLGVSFRTRDELMANLAHVIYPDNESRTQVADGLWVATVPQR